MYRALSLALVLFLAGCPDEVVTPADDDDTTADTPDPIDLTERLGPDEARAGQLTEDHEGAFVGGAAAESRPGDFLLYNDRARFVIRGLRDGCFYAGYPGSIIDMDIVRPDGQADRDGMDDMMTMMGLAWLFSAEQIEVIADGSDGGAAVIQATGTDTTFEFLEGAIEAHGLFPPRGLEVVQTFTLDPGSPALQLETFIRNTTDDDLSLDIIDAGMVDLATFSPFVPGAGFDGEAPEGGRTMLAMASHRNDLAVAAYPTEGNLVEGAMTALSDEFELVAAQGDTLDLGPGDEDSYTRWIAVARDQAALEAHRRLVQELDTATVEGAVTADGAPVAGARVFLTDLDGNPEVLAISDDEGRFSIVYEAGDHQLVVVGDGNNELMDFPAALGAYGVYAHASANELAMRAYTAPAASLAAPQADGHGRSEVVAVALEAGQVVEADLTLVAPAQLQLTVQDGDGDPIPALVHIRFPSGVSDPEPRDSRLGESRPRGGARKVVWVLDGEMTVPMVPGTYDLVGHRGFRFEMDTVEGVELISGQTHEQTLVLEQAFETPGWISADMHNHASPSMDGECTVEERLASAVVAEVQLQVSTDHDHVADYRPAAAAMGLDAWMVSVVGDEISPTIRGHHNAYPIEPWPDEPNGGAPRWWEVSVTTSELYEMWRDRIDEDAVLQVNHGRGSGMFAYAEFDAVNGVADDPDFYCDAFDVMEVLNSGGYGDAEQLREDWRAHLDLGLRKTAVGVSDSHGRLPGTGHGRTYVRAGVDDVADLDEDAFVVALKAQQAVVSGGPFVTLTATDGGDVAEIGETLEASSATLQIEVLAPSWMQVDEVRLYSNGILSDTWIVDAPAPPVWFDHEVEVTPDQDTYYFVEVEGSGDMAPLWSGAHAYALTNPVYVEVP